MLKLPPTKLEPQLILWSFFLLRLLFIFINLQYSHVWNTIVKNGLLPLVAIWNCQINYRNRYEGLLVLHLLPVLYPWLIVEMLPMKVFSIGITLVDAHLNWVSWFRFLILQGSLLVILINCMIFLSPFLDVTRMSCQQTLSLQSQNLESSPYRMLSFNL